MKAVIRKFANHRFCTMLKCIVFKSNCYLCSLKTEYYVRDIGNKLEYES